MRVRDVRAASVDGDADPARVGRLGVDRTCADEVRPLPRSAVSRPYAMASLGLPLVRAPLASVVDSDGGARTGKRLWLMSSASNC